MFEVDPTWASFIDVIEEKYQLVEKYDDQYTKWTIIHQHRDSTVLQNSNSFHTLCIKLGIRDLELHLVLNNHSDLNWQIQINMQFMYISSLGYGYQYSIKIEHKIEHKIEGKNQWDFRLANSPLQKNGKGIPQSRNKAKHKGTHPRMVIGSLKTL